MLYREKPLSAKMGVCLCSTSQTEGSYCLGVLYGLQGKSILGLCKTYHRMFRGGTTSKERERNRWFEEEKSWENRGIGG